MKGTIRRLIADRGFGFIRPEDATALQKDGEYFFHRSACPRGLFESLREGQWVSFDVVPAQDANRGPRATNVMLTG